MAERKLTLTILGTASSALRALKDTGDAATGMGKRLSSILPSFKTVSIAATAAFGATSAAMYKAVQAAAEDQKSQEMLARQMKESVNASDLFIASTMKQLSALQMTAAVSEDVLRPALGTLVRATGDVTKSQELLKLALDISAGSGKDLNAVTIALGRAATGSTMALSKLGVPLDENAVKTKDFNKIVEALGKSFSGASAAAAGTFSGQLERLKLGFGEVVEAIGYELLPYAERFVKFMNDSIVPAIQLFVDNVKEKGIGGALAMATASMGEFGQSAINVLESAYLSILTFTNQIAKTVRIIADGAALAYGLKGNLLGAAKALAVAVAMKEIQESTGEALANAGAMFDGFRHQVYLASTELANFGKPSKDVSDSAERMAQATRSAVNANRTFIPTLKDVGSGAGGASDKLDTLAKKTDAYEKALNDLNSTSKTTRDAFKSVDDAAKSLGKATTKVKEAQDKFNLVTNGYSTSSKEYISALRDVERANKSVRDATIRQKDALDAVRDAEKKLADLRAKTVNPDDIAAAERNLERSKFDVEQSNFAVLDAENALAELRKDPLANPIEIRKAEIGLAEAKFGVTESIIAQRDAETDLANARNMAATPEEIAAAERDLEDAKRSQTDATDDLAEAIYQQSALQSVLTEVTYGAAEGSETYRQALLDLQEAQDDEAAAADRHTDALERQKEAVQDLKNAIADLNEIQGKVNQKAISRAEGKVGKTTTDLLKNANQFINSSIAATMPNFDSVFEHMAMRGSIPMFADGGVVTKPTLGLVGEAGAEAIIPLDKLGSMGGTINITINAGMGTDPAKLGDQIVDVLTRYQRRNGSLPLKVA